MKRKIYLWGDSIGKGVVYQPARRRYCLAQERCEKRLRERGIDLESHARMGATVAEGFSDFVATPTEAGALAVIEFGGNDCDLDWQAVSERPEVFHDGRTPLAEFAELLRLFAETARGRGLEPVLVLPPPLQSQRYFDWVCRGRNREAVGAYLGDVEHIGRWHGCYVEAIRAAARESGSRVLDLWLPFLRAANFRDLICEDGIHPSEAGQALITRVALDAMGAG